MGDEYGLAKKATAIAVRVLNDFGGGTSAYVFVQALILYDEHHSLMYTVV